MIRNLIAAAMSCSFVNERIVMEQMLLEKVQILEDQLGRTEDAWLKRIWDRLELPKKISIKDEKGKV